MQKRLIIILIIFVLATFANAAQQYYQFPDASSLSGSDRILIYKNASSASRNITGQMLREDIAAFAHLSTSRRIANATQIFNLMTTATANKLVKRAAPGADQYARVFEIKNGSGTIVQYINASGTTVYGTPRALQVSSVYPANGATGVLNTSADPSVTYNKRVSVTISTQYIQGSSVAPAYYDSPATWTFSNFSGMPGTTYTMKVNRAAITQTDGETTSSCAAGMPDVAGYCTSTFTMQ